MSGGEHVAARRARWLVDGRSRAADRAPPLPLRRYIHVSCLHEHNGGCCRSHHVRSRRAWLRGGQIPVVAAFGRSHCSRIAPEEVMNASAPVSLHKVVSQEEWL